MVIKVIIFMKRVLYFIKNFKEICKNSTIKYIQKINKKTVKNDCTKVPFFLRNQVFIKNNGAFITNSYKVFKKILKYNKSEKTQLFYCSIDNWDYKAAMEKRYNQNLKFINEYFMPLIEKEDEICDIGCASGQFTFEFAKYCKQIDGYDISERLIKSANNFANENKILNAKFYIGNCESIKLNKIYDKISFMGVLSYVFDDKKAYQTIKNIYNALKPNGYLIYKDNSNNTNKDYYFFGPERNYKMIAKSKNKIVNMFEKNGFRIIKEAIFDEVVHENIQNSYAKKQIKPIITNSIGMIFQKI